MNVLETERLLIEEATVDDGLFFLALVNSPNWLQYIGDRNIKSEEDAAQYIDTFLVKSYRTNGFGLYKLVEKEENKPIGICGFVKRTYLTHVDLGFALLPQYEGKGYVYEAASSILKYGHTKLSLSTVLAISRIENKRSHRLLYRLGFHDAGTLQPDLDKPALLLYST